MKTTTSYWILFLLLSSTISIAQVNFEWLQSAGAGGTNEAMGRAIATDEDLNVIIGGFLTGEAKFGEITVGTTGQKDFFVAKYDSQGNVLWVKTGGSEALGGQGWDFVDDIAVDLDGHIYIAGYVGVESHFYDYDFPSGSGAFLCKLDPDGNFIWGDSYFTSYTFDSYKGKGQVECDADGNVFFATQFINDISLHDTLLVFPNYPGKNQSNGILTMKFDSDGNRLWFRTGYGYSANVVEGLKVDAEGKVIIYGINKWTMDFGNGALGGATWLVKYANDGALLWSTNLPSLGSEEPKGMDLDEGNNIFITDRVFARGVGVKKVGPHGNFLWGKYIGESDFMSPTAIACQYDTCYLTGWFEDTLFVEHANVLARGVKDIFLIALDANNGDSYFVTRAGSDVEFPLGYYDAGYDLCKNDAGLYMTGAYKGTADFGSIETTAGGVASDVFLTKINIETATEIIVQNRQSVEVYPNPARRIITLKFDEFSIVKTVKLFAINGRQQILMQSIENGLETKINIENFGPGVYVLVAETEDGGIIRRKIVIAK